LAILDTLQISSAICFQTVQSFSRNSN